jgi:hypothetical protein
MHQSSLLQLTQSFDKKAIRQLAGFLHSAAINKDVLSLFVYIRKYHHKPKSPKLSKEHAWHSIFPKQKFSDNRMRKLMFHLKTSIEEFIKIEAVRNDQQLQQKLLINYYYHVEDFEHFSKRIYQQIEELNDQPERDANYHLEMLWLYEKLFYHTQNEDRQRFKPLDQLVKLGEQVDYLYALLKMRLETDINIRKKLIREDLNMPIPFEKIKEQLFALKKESNLLDLYTDLIDFQQTNQQINPIIFDTCIQFFQNNIREFGHKERAILWNVLINISIAEYNAGHEEFVASTAKLFKLADEYNMIVYQGHVQMSTFMNATFTGAGAQEFVWVDSFINRYKEYLDKKDKEHLVSLCHGALLYHQGKILDLKSEGRIQLFRDTIEILSQIPYTGIAFDLPLRSLQFRVLFDLSISTDETLQFDTYARSLEKYLRDKEDLSENREQSYLAFVKETRKLARIFKKISEGRGDKNSLNTFYNSLCKKENIAFKIWLKKTVRELKKHFDLMP